MRDPRHIASRLRLLPALAALAAGPVAAVLPPPDFDAGRPLAEGPAPPRRFRVVQGDDLPGRLALACDDARRRGPAKGYWVGYSFEPRPDTAGEAGAGSIGRGAGTVFFLCSPAGAVERVATDDDAVRAEDGRPAYWLGHASNGESLAHLRRLLQCGEPPSIAPVLAQAISQHGGPRCAATLRDLARLSPRPEVRGSAAIALIRLPGQIGFVSGVVLDRREDLEIRRQVAVELGRAGGPEGLRALEAMAAVVTDEPLRQVIVAAARGQRLDEARLRSRRP